MTPPEIRRASLEAGWSGAVLIVDDEIGVRDILLSLLSEDGYLCAVAANGEDAMSKLAESEFDCVLSDVRMPGMSGMELLKHIKEIRRDVAVIMATAVTDLDAALEAMRLGAHDYLTKPFNLDLVSLTVERAIEKKRLIEENREYQRTLEEKVEERTKELSEKNQELRDLFLSSIRALAQALEAKDGYTQGHSMRAAADAVKVARYLALPEEEIESIRLAGLLHDIGKIGIKEAVLNKPGKLDATEWQQVHEHPVLAEKILTPIEELKDVIKIIRHHHERFDGEGYPDALRGNEIPLGARILSVTDSYDAMISARPYRAPLRADEAAAVLQEEAGAQFDPVVVRAFVTCVTSQESATQRSPSPADGSAVQNASGSGDPSDTPPPAERAEGT